jgi:hypothetical protein
MFKEFLKLALLLPLVTLAAPALAEQAGETLVAVDWSSLQRTGERAQLWVTRTFPETITLGHAAYPHRSQVLQYAIQCGDETLALSQWILTDAEDGAGRTVWKGRSPNLVFEPAGRYSVEAAVVHTACAIESASNVAHTGK